MAQSLFKPDDAEPQCPTAIRQALADVLESGSEPDRCLAVQALGRMGGGWASDLLIAALRDPDPDVRGDAAVALSRSQDGRALAPLKANLPDDPCGDVKVLYIEALAALDAEDCADLFCVLATGRGDDHGIVWDDDVADWDDWLDVQRAAIKALGACKQAHLQSDAVEAILSALKDPGGQDLWALACPTLAKLGAAGTSALEELTNDASALNRKRVAKALALATKSESGALLDRLLKDGEASVRIAAIGSAVALGKDDALDTAMGDRTAEVRAAVLTGMLRSDSKLLAKGLNDIDGAVRLAACEAVIRFGKPCPGLGLTARIERGLRTASESLLSAMVAAAIIAEPEDVEPLIEEMANHRATAPKVRCACLRGLGELNSGKAVDLLSKSIGDARQDVRLEAIVALAKISRLEGPAAKRALNLLATAIGGDLIKMPDGWQPEENNIVRFVPKKGAQAAGDDGDARIKLDREGNVVNLQEEEAVIEAGPEEREAAPTSTLEAIVSFRPDTPKNEIEISDADLEFLELTGARHKRRRLDPQSSPPAHIDVRRQAACLAGETGRGDLVVALVSVLGERDRQLCDTALASLERLGAVGVDVSEAEHDLVLLAGGSDLGLRCRAVSVLSFIATREATEQIERAIADGEGTLRAAGLRAAGKASRIAVNPYEYGQDPDRNARLAAAAIAAHDEPAVAIPFLFGLAQVEDGVHKTDIAGLLAGRYEDCESLLIDWIAGSDPKKRLIGLQMLPVVAAAV